MAVVKIGGRGQLTIPAVLRKELRLHEETTLNVVKVGEALVLTPRRLHGDSVAKKAQKEMEKAHLSLEDFLEDLDRQRERYNQEQYEG